MRRFGRGQSTCRKHGRKALGRGTVATRKRCAAAGFSLLELLIVVAIGVVVTGMAIPMTINAMRTYRLNAAVASATGAIQSTRYAAVMHGYSYEITFTPATNSYQVYAMIPPASTYSALGTAIPISRPGDVAISRTVTYKFAAGGTVSETSTPQNMSFQITNGYGGSNTITVSGVGNVSVGSP